MSPVELGQALEGLPKVDDPRLLVGYEQASDASVYALNDGQLLLQTVDFFTPVVDDPYVFGRISAANSLSDIYAMGGTPITALNVVCFPKKMGMDTLNQILRGGADKALEARVSISGGHTVDDIEPKYGLAVTGMVSRDQLITNAGAVPGDVLVLTKPLGSGVLTTALKAGTRREADLARVVEIMDQLNDKASRLMGSHHVHACTDITGFGLLGHLWEMCMASGVGCVLNTSQVPVLPEALPLTGDGNLPGGGYANMEYLRERVSLQGKVERAIEYALYDPQTSGGLLMAVPPSSVSLLLVALRETYPWADCIGEVIQERRLCLRS